MTEATLTDNPRSLIEQLIAAKEKISDLERAQLAQAYLSAIIESADDALQDLAGLRHYEAETVEVGQHFEQLVTLERLHGIGQFGAFAECSDQVGAGLRSTARDTGGICLVHLKLPA